MAAEGKYGRITTERGDIPDDEPVFLIRAQDRVAVALLDRYAMLAEAAGSPPRHLTGTREAIERFVAWQSEHPDRVKTPGVPRS